MEASGSLHQGHLNGHILLEAQGYSKKGKTGPQNTYFGVNIPSEADNCSWFGILWGGAYALGVLHLGELFFQPLKKCSFGSCLTHHQREAYS